METETSGDYEFYGALPSYYSAKGRAYLQVKRLPFVDRGATADAYREVILPRTGKAFIPVVVTPAGEVLQDTCDIIDELERRHPEPPIVPAEPLLRFASMLMEYYADECLIYPGLHMRWHYDENRAWVVPEFARANMPGAPDAVPLMEKFAGAIQRFAAALGMDDPAGREACRAVFDRLMARLDAHFATAPYLLGPRPSLGDVALMGPVFGHFHRDLYSSQLLRRDAPYVCIWVERMCHGNAAAREGVWRLTDSARSVFAEIGAGFAEFTRDTQDALDRHLRAQTPGEPLPRVIPDELRTTILGRPVHLRVLNTYWAYKQQRVRDAYGTVAAADRGVVDAFLADVGLQGLFETPPPWRTEKNAAGWLVVRR